MQPNINALNNFDLNSLPDLDTVVLAALELFTQANLPKIDTSAYQHPLVTGSGNAEATSRIIFADSDAVFASESNFESKLQRRQSIDEVVIISASGGKHAPVIAQTAKQYGKHVTLITNTPNSPVKQALSEDDLTEYVFPKNREPYTYNTSTYLGMILGHTGEDAAEIYDFIRRRVANLDLPDFSKHNKYYLIVPPHFSGVIRMLQIKFIELFGRNLARDVETSEYVRHATTVAPGDEMFISFGEANDTWGKPENRLHVPLPENADYGAMMAIGYYVIAQIQKAQPDYFKQNIAEYCQFISGVFGEDISPVVPGN